MLLAREQCFAMHFEQGWLPSSWHDEVATRACQSMTECKLDQWLRIDTADDGALESQ
jgi:hypothetical protein